MLQDREKLLYDLLYYVPSKLIPAILAFLLVIVLTHSLTPDEFGQYATVLAIVNLSDTLVSAWVRQSILRFYPDYQVEGHTREFQEKVLALMVLATLIAGLVTGMAMRALGYGIEQVVLTLGVLLSQIVFSYLVTLYQSSRLSRHYATVTIIQSIVQIVWVLGLVYLGRGGYPSAVLAVAAGYLSSVLYMFLIRAKTNIHFGLSFKNLDWALNRNLLAYGLPMSIWMLCFQILFLGNRLIIGSLRSLKEVGIYASAYDLVNGSLSLVMTPFLLAAHPIILQLWAQSHERTVIEELIERIFRYLLLLFAPIFFFSLTVNEELFFVLGRGFGIEGWVVPVLVAGAFCGGFSMYVHKGLEIARRTGIMMGVAILTAVLNVMLNLLFVGQYGYPAAAVITLISYAFYMVVVYGFSRQYVRIRIPWKSVFRICVAGGITGACLWLVKRAMVFIPMDSVLGIALCILLSGGIYLIVLTISGELTPERQGFLKSAGRYKVDKVTKEQSFGPVRRDDPQPPGEAGAAADAARDLSDV